ncbi:MAG: universal stress protein [Mucilaginibacter sp.]|jgi:nucleotide-binding universal stress UspA family protein|uniref:universal stress protein n=1 Tax=Mucilaginibacter sp. TaxID=1882438 RepID=UPI00356730FF
MKTILTLTDFSENAACAAKAGLVLSAKLKTDLLLFNTYIDYATLPYESGGGWDVDDFSLRKQHSVQGLESLTEGLESIAVKLLEPAGHKPTVQFQSSNCDLGMKVAEIIKAQNIELVVMGARSKHPDDPLPGADTSAVIKNTSRPVLVVPTKTDLYQIRKIIFATNFDESDLKAIRYLMKLGKLMNYQLHITHVSKPGEDKITAKEQAFKEQLELLNYQGLNYRKVNGKDLVARLNELTAEDGPAILAFLHHQLSFMIRLFSRSKTKAALARQRTPLLIFPSKMSN